MEEFGLTKESWLKNFLRLPNGVLSHDTIGRVFSRLNPEHLEQCFLAWVKSLIQVNGTEVIAIDVKTVRRSYDGEHQAIHMISAWVTQNGLVLGQLKTENKSNEITTMPELLGMINVTGCIVIIEAMVCQRTIAQAILEHGGDYILALKVIKKPYMTMCNSILKQLERKHLQVSSIMPMKR